MTPGIWTAFLIELPPEEMVRTFAEKDWRMLELSTEHSAMLLEQGSPDKVGKEFSRFAEDYGVGLPQGHLWIESDIAASNQAEVLAELKRWLDLYLALGIRSGVLHPGGREMEQQGQPPEKIREAKVRALTELTAHIRGTDLHICLENCGCTADLLCDLIEATGSGNLGICLDTGHLNLLQGDQGQFIRTAGPLLKALHIADNEGAFDQHLMPYGRGTVAWDDVVSALREISYDGLFNFEIPGENRCPIPVRLAKLDYLKSILPILLGDAA